MQLDLLAFYTIVHKNNKFCWRFIPLFIKTIRFVGGLYYCSLILYLMAVYTIVHKNNEICWRLIPLFIKNKFCWRFKPLFIKNKICWRFIPLFIDTIRFVGGLYYRSLK